MFKVSLFAALISVVAIGWPVVRAQQKPQQPSFRAATTLVEVDVIVKDRKSAFVADLVPGDFEVLEEGVAQNVEQCFVVAGPVVKATPAQGAVSPPDLPAAQTQRTFVLLFDTLHMAPAEVGRAKKAALEFMTSTFREGDVGGVVTPTGLVNNRLTNVRSELESAIAGIKPSADERSMLLAMREWPRLLDAYEVYLIADRNDREATARAVQRAVSDRPNDRGVQAEAELEVPSKAQQLLPMLRATGQQTMRAVAALSSGLAKLAGRKTIILLTDGFFVEDSWANLRAVVDLANRANVRVYTLDTRGLNRGSASSDILDAGPRAAVNPAGEVTGFDTGSDGPNSLAVDTGGFVVRNENDFPKALNEIAIDTSSYYILGYRPTNTAFDGKFRSITVRVKRPGVSVRARKGYLAVARTVQAPPDNQAAAVPAPATEAQHAKAAAPPTAVAPTPPTPAAANVPPPRDAVRLQPDVKDRLARLGKNAPDAKLAAVPDAVTARARAGWEAYQQGDLQQARTALREAASHPASPAWVHYALGWAEYGERGYAAAVSEWERVRIAAADFEPVYFDLADAYLQMREFGKALDVLRRAQERWPKDVEVYNAIGSVQVVRGAFNDAIATFEQGVAVKPDDATVCYNLAKTSELRYVQSARLRVVGQSLPAVLADKDRAIEYYRRTIAIGTLFVEQAREGLKRLGQEH